MGVKHWTKIFNNWITQDSSNKRMLFGNFDLFRDFHFHHVLQPSTLELRRRRKEKKGGQSFTGNRQLYWLSEWRNWPRITRIMYDAVMWRNFSLVKRALRAKKRKFEAKEVESTKRESTKLFSIFFSLYLLVVPFQRALTSFADDSFECLSYKFAIFNIFAIIHLYLYIWHVWENFFLIFCHREMSWNETNECECECEWKGKSFWDWQKAVHR